jgi:hypothetical protein
MISRKILGVLEADILSLEIEPLHAYVEWVDKLPTLLNEAAELPGSTYQMKVALRGLSVILQTADEMVNLHEIRRQGAETLPQGDQGLGS